MSYNILKIIIRLKMRRITLEQVTIIPSLNLRCKTASQWWINVFSGSPVFKLHTLTIPHWHATWVKKVKGTDYGYNSSFRHLTATGTHMPYGITRHSLLSADVSDLLCTTNIQQLWRQNFCTGWTSFVELSTYPAVQSRHHLRTV